MQISLNIIQPSPNPIRTTWDDEKLNELAQSLKEQGLIQPIKLRPLMTIQPCKHHGWMWLEEEPDDYETFDCVFCNEERGKLENVDEDGDPDGWITQPVFEIVYGHRRVEAAKRAGFTTINAIIDDIDDQQTLIQALIENLQREDMNDIDIAKGLRALQDVAEWNTRDIERAGVMEHSRAALYLALLNEPESIQQMIETGDQITSKHLRQVRAAIPDDIVLKTAVLQKAADENLSSAQTRRVAESVAAAPGEHAKQTLLNRPYSEYTHDPDLIKERANKFGAHDPLYTNMAKSHLNEDWQTTPEVTNVIALMKSWMGSLTEFRKADELGKMSPEAKGFVARRVRQFAEALTEWADKLEGEENGN